MKAVAAVMTAMSGNGRRRLAESGSGHGPRGVQPDILPVTNISEFK